MTTDLQAAAAFYATAQGGVAARLLRERLALLWPPDTLRGQRLLGFGHATPYLRLWREGTRCVNLAPNQPPPARWPAGAPSLTCAAEEDALPFADLSFDRILLVHGLEGADHARRLLRELWRVLKDDGQLLVVAPNRRGLWAHTEAVPFGQGEPYSPGQLGRLLASALFRPEARDTALFLPPLASRLVLRSAPLWDRAGRRLAPRFAGVTLCTAVKDLYAALPRQPAPRRRVVLAPVA